MTYIFEPVFQSVLNALDFLPILFHPLQRRPACQDVLGGVKFVSQKIKLTLSLCSIVVICYLAIVGNMGSIKFRVYHIVKSFMIH